MLFPQWILKQRAWLKDKLTGCPFALPALYHPESLIPLNAWKASPPSSNGNEQSHRGINRDGVNLTILGGIMRGWQYDPRAFLSLELHSEQVAVQRRTARREPDPSPGQNETAYAVGWDFPSNSYNGIEGRRDDELALTNKSDEDDGAEIWAEVVDFEPPSTEVICGNIWCAFQIPQDIPSSRDNFLRAVSEGGKWPCWDNIPW
ncbi:hypothetical protein K443DRAFT_125774 [Laccaria amethystina LaAM-08-1]|uniref:Uncharacterized protein n=1 Tax=Laccaria amethystina LaAM-08-1 TaxID=1095629 RepID=A0A0C9X5L6_9AGAR|nr:hypothetical protein K443DRAFT_125774 [Laccaria amethystina LaAM-08-1]